MSPPPGPVFVAGCGYLGLPAAQFWRDHGRQVYALTRARPDELRAERLTPVVADVTDAASLTALRDLPPIDTLLYAIGLDRRAGKSMREVYVGGLSNVMARLPIVHRVISISSTSVYGQTGGEWVDGYSPTQPAEDDGKIVLEAEAVLRQSRPDATILRFAGIYGPGRVMRAKHLMAGEPYTSDPEKWLNLIHVHDGVSAIMAAERANIAGRTVTISDGNPVTRREFYTTLAQMLGAPPARFTPREGNPGEVNRRVRGWDGFESRFPSYKSGLANALGGSGDLS